MGKVGQTSVCWFDFHGFLVNISHFHEVKEKCNISGNVLQFGRLDVRMSKEFIGTTTKLIVMNLTWSLFTAFSLNILLQPSKTEIGSRLSSGSCPPADGTLKMWVQVYREKMKLSLYRFLIHMKCSIQTTFEHPGLFITISLAMEVMSYTLPNVIIYSIWKLP